MKTIEELVELMETIERDSAPAVRANTELVAHFMLRGLVAAVKRDANEHGKTRFWAASRIEEAANAFIGKHRKDAA